jgi:hypothetical protein
MYDKVNQPLKISAELLNSRKSILITIDNFILKMNAFKKEHEELADAHIAQQFRFL